MHTAADGKKYLVIHGHQADGLTHFQPPARKAGSHLYNWILDFNLYFNRVRRIMGFWLLVAGGVFEIQGQVAVKFVTEYETTLATWRGPSGRWRDCGQHSPRRGEDDRRPCNI